MAPAGTSPGPAIAVLAVGAGVIAGAIAHDFPTYDNCRKVGGAGLLARRYAASRAFASELVEPLFAAPKSPSLYCLHDVAEDVGELLVRRFVDLRRLDLRGQPRGLRLDELAVDLRSRRPSRRAARPRSTPCSCRSRSSPCSPRSRGLRRAGRSDVDQALLVHRAACAFCDAAPVTSLFVYLPPLGAACWMITGAPPSLHVSFQRCADSRSRCARACSRSAMRASRSAIVLLARLRSRPRAPRSARPCRR